MPPPAISPSPPYPLTPSGHPRRVAVIGGGISGLAAAYRITELDPAAQITLFEASDRLGGVLQTERKDGWLIERSADMFTTREPWALDLCRRIGIADELIGTDAANRRAFVVRRRKLVPVPEGFTLMSPARVWPIIRTPLLSPLGKLRLACEYFQPARKDDADESLESFAVRRFGREAFERLIQPLIGGIYTADPARLSMRATLPQFVELERKFGSLVRGMRSQGTRDRSQGSGVRSQESQASGKREPPGNGAPQETSSGARYGLFLAPRDGMQRIVEALAARLPAGSVRLNSLVAGIEYDGLWRVSIAGGIASETFDDIILAAPGAVSSRLVRGFDGQLADLVGGIEHAGCAVALAGYRRDQIAHPLNGFGFVVPAIEKRRIIAGSFASVKFPGRAPDGKVLIRVFIGGALQPGLAELPENSLHSIVQTELAELLGVRGEPEFFEVARWAGAMPQYHVGHLEVVRQIEERARAISHFALAGNSYRGVGIPFCIHSGEQAAERIMAARDLATDETRIEHG